MKSETGLLIGSIINVVSIYLANYFGYMFMLIPALLLAIATFVIFAGAASMLSLIIDYDAIKKQYDETKRPNSSILFMSQTISCISVYTIYSFGFVFTSGIFASTMSILMIGTFFSVIIGRKEKT